MKLFDNMIRAIEDNSRRNERKKLIEELQDIFINREYDDARIRWISERLNVLDGADLSAYLNRNKPVKSVAQMVEEDDCGLPEGMVRTCHQALWRCDA